MTHTLMTMLEGETGYILYEMLKENAIKTLKNKNFNLIYWFNILYTMFTTHYTIGCNFVHEKFFSELMVYSNSIYMSLYQEKFDESCKI